jgi:uncharacterized membrane protein
MSQFQESIDVAVPVRTAYNQWTQFESFPRFMEGVQRVEQLDDRRLHWRAEIGGKEVEWDATITEQIPDKRIAWKSTSGARHAGVVDFHRLDDTHTRVTLQIDYEPEGALEKAGDLLGIVKMRVKGDLERFEEFIEARGAESGGWRGTLPNRDERAGR